jgi:Bor protein
MKRQVSTALALALVSSMACYHATINTGRNESSTVVEEQWAKGWVFGLVPPDPLDVSKQCAGGVAKVETQHTFLNMLVQWLTIDIFTPMDIKVTCAGAGMAPKTSMVTPSDHTPAAERDAFAQAVQQAKSSGEPVFVRF